MRALGSALLGAGYAASVAVLTRFVPVVRQRRWRWLVVHHLGVVSIIAGWAVRRQGPAVVVNSCWLALSTVWYLLGGRRGGTRRP